MHQREEKSSTYTGLKAYYENGDTVLEKENYFSKKLNKQCATNWAEIDKTRLVALELVWCDQVKVRLQKIPDDPDSHPELKPSDWFFSHTGYMDMKARKILVVSRNIGYAKDGILFISSVMEDSGIVRMHTRAA